MTGRLFPRTALFRAIGLMLAAIGGGLAVRAFNLGWVGAAVLTVALALATVAAMRTAERHSEAIGATSPALTRYHRRMVVASMVYMVGFFAAMLAYRRFNVEGPLLWLAGFAPSVGTLGMIWAMARLMIEERDEYLRARITNQALAAIGVVLVLTTVWGFLEQFGLVPHVPNWAVLPIFAVALGIGNCIRWARS